MRLILILNKEYNMEQKIIKFENRDRTAAQRSYKKTYHLQLEGLNSAENFLVWMTQYWVRSTIQRIDPLPLIRKSIEEILDKKNQEEYVQYINYIFYLFFNISSYPLTLGCQHCKKLGSFELNFMALVSFQQNDDDHLTKNLLGHILGINYSEDTKNYIDLISEIYLKSNLKLQLRPEYQDLFQLKSPSMDHSLKYLGSIN